MSRARDLANLGDDSSGLETLTVSDITDLTASATELNYTDGVSSALQTQIDTKAPTASPAFTGTPTGITASHITSGTLGNTVQDNITRLGTVTNGTFNGTIGSSATVTSGINMPDFNLNLSSGQNRIISFGSKGIQIWGVVDSTGTGNSSAQTGIYGGSSSSGSLKVMHLTGYVGKTGTRNDIGRVRSWADNMYVLDRANGYLQGPTINAVGSGTLSPSGSRWSLQFNSGEDYELQLASADGGTFYYSLFGFKV